MMVFARSFAAIAACVIGLASATAALAQASPVEVERTWTNMVLLLTRHTPTYSPPVASRTFAYLSVAAYEAVAAGESSDLRSLAGQLNGLTAGPKREPGATYDEAIVLETTMASVVKAMFANTGPTGQRAFAAQEEKLRAATAEGVAPYIITRSEAFGAAVAAHILDWASTDGSPEIVNMGFPPDYKLIPGPAHWVPTSNVVQQQTPLLPTWRDNRPFAMPKGAACPAPPALAYSEDPQSAFYKEAKEVYDTRNSLTPDQAAIARFWADDPMLSFTPPGHWISIALQVLEKEQMPLDKSVDLLMRVTVAEADAFIGCWDTKFIYDLVRPVTYIRRLIDPDWTTLINTPPFPEYTSGHSVSSAAAATVLTAILGDHYAFTDTTGGKDNLPMRQFSSFWEAADQAGISRLYAGIHYRAAIEKGLTQGECIGNHTVNLKTWK